MKVNVFIRHCFRYILDFVLIYLICRFMYLIFYAKVAQWPYVIVNK